MCSCPVQMGKEVIGLNYSTDVGQGLGRISEGSGVLVWTPGPLCWQDKPDGRLQMWQRHDPSILGTEGCTG